MRRTAGNEGGRLRSSFALLLAAALTVVGCDVNPAGPILQIEGTYAGSWAFDFFIEGAFQSRSVCPGSITLADQTGRTYGGAFVVDDEGDCLGLSPISGDVLEGSVRANGGVDFQISRVPVVGAGVAGCAVLIDPEAGGELTGAVEGSELAVITIVDLDCGDRGLGSAQITMSGSR